MSKKVYGSIKEVESRKGIQDLIVEVYDDDLLYDDFLGKDKTNGSGEYTVGFRDNAAGLFDRPDVYIVVKTPEGKFLQSTRTRVMKNIKSDIRVDIEIPRFTLFHTGVIKEAPAEWNDIVKMIRERPEYRRFVLKDDHDPDDALLKEIEKELEGKVSILELFKHYIHTLKGNLDNDALTFKKLAKLFEYGKDVNDLEGHYYGSFIGLKSGNLSGKRAEFGNLLGFLWGYVQGDEGTWVGKTLRRLNPDEIADYTDKSLQTEQNVYLGINHYNSLEMRPLNQLGISVLNLWVGLDQATRLEKEKYGHEKRGTPFLGYFTDSVLPGMNRKIFQVNYRWKKFSNKIPFSILLDEIVQVAENLYLGQLVAATRNGLAPFDPARDPEEYNYEHFGYFIIFGDLWIEEARRIFPFLEIPAAIRGQDIVNINQTKFRTLTMEEGSTPCYHPEIFKQITGDLKTQPTIMHLLKTYYSEIRNARGSDVSALHKLKELFHRGISVKTMEGFYRGALMGRCPGEILPGNEAGIFRQFKTGILRRSCAWTGQVFKPMSQDQLEYYTDNSVKAGFPIFWGSNTHSVRTMQEKLAKQTMDFTNVWMEQTPDDIASRYGYDYECFFFVGQKGGSFSQECRDKMVFQLNYRWPKLKTIFPDSLYIEELVRIAKGLYLGHSLYAADILKKYDPECKAVDYNYRLFDYFLLFDEEWHKIRLETGLDPEQV